MNKSIAALFGLFAATAVLAGCNGSNNGFPGPFPTSGPTGNCGGPPSGNQLEVVYPIPGSHSAPPALANIYIATKGGLPPSNQFDFFLTQSNGGQTYTGNFAAINESQIPKPHKIPKYSNPTYYATSLPPSYYIGPNQAVSLLWNDGGRNCVPHFLVASFSTKK